MLLLVHVEAGLHMLDQLHLVHLGLGTLCEKEEKLVLTDDGPIGQFNASAAQGRLQIQADESEL